MTKVIKNIIKCSKCGKESEQQIVCSVNYLLGTKEDNDKLMNHKQKCPYCNYEAVDIRILNNKLERNQLEKITEQFVSDTNKYEIFKIPDELYLDCFNKLEQLLNNNELEDDERFVTYGRLDLLKQELTDRLNDEKLKYEDSNWKGKWDNRLGAFWDLYDYIRGDRYFGPFHIPEGKNFNELLLANDQYYKDGYICKEEKIILLEMINEIKMFIKQNNLKEDDSMGLIDNMKNKYNIKEENNRPQIVYGIPDDMRKKWEKEEVENSKYDVEPEENVPQFVYGIPDYFRYQNENNIFEAFEGGYFGPSSYYYIDLIDNNCYEFKYGYSKDGKRIFNDSNSDELFITKHNKEFYDNFIQELRNMTINWKDSYVDENVMDGTQWNLDIKSINKSFSGSNAFPKNYNEVKLFLDRMFNVDMYNMQKKYNVEPEENVPYEVYGIPDASLNKYDISPEDNIPQKVYGIPKPNTNNNSNQKNNSIYKESIVFKIKKEDKNYALMINKRNETEASITFCDANKISEMDPSDIGVRLPSSFYNKIRRQILDIVSNWDNQYIGEKNCEWNLTVTIEDSSECAIGKGGFPENWNEFIELMSKYELLYKKLLINNKSKVELLNRKDKPIEEFVKDKVQDNESCKLILENLNKELGTSNYMKVLTFVDLCKYEDILNEYIKCLKINNEQFYEHLENPISIKGYNAKQLKDLNNKFNITGLYTFMGLLRDDFITAKKVLDSNFTYNPIKDKLESNSSNKEDEKCPYCGSNELYKYLYGEPTFDYDKEKYVLGGCEIGLDRPIYKCKKCGNDIGKNFNPFDDNLFDESVEVDFDIELLKKTIEASEREDFCTTNVASKFVDGTPFTYGSSLCEELSAFYKYLYDNNFIDLNYLENVKKIENKEIDKLSFEEIMTKLTLPHRAERFCDGAIHSFVESGDMKKCLKRLLNILENKS